MARTKLGASARTTALDTTDEVAADSSWRSIALVVIGALLAGLAAAWLGYRTHLGEQPGTSTETSAAPSGTKSPARAASGAVGQGSKEPVERVALQTPASTSTPTSTSTNTSASASASASGPASAAKLSWPIWEFRLRQPIPPRDPSLTPPTWRLIGSSLAGGRWSIIVLRQGNTAPEYFSVGQELPGGYRIDAINDQDVTLTQGKRVMVLSYIGSR